MERFKSREFDIEIKYSDITISGPYGLGKLSFSAGEGSLVREFLGILWRLGGLPSFPLSVDSPTGTFVAEPDEEFILLKRKDEYNNNVGLLFKLAEVDWLIDAVDAGVAKAADVMSLQATSRGTGAYNYNGPLDSDIIEGR